MGGFLASLFGGNARPLSLDAAAWEEVVAQPVFDGLNPDELARLRSLAEQLLADKSFSGAGGAQVDAYMATVIAAFAVLPILNLDYGLYRGWREIVVYPAEFIHEADHLDEHGIVHHVRHARSGEAMDGGPLVLSWDDVAASGGGEGYNVVIHEFAHKLDMRNGGVNGRPPLPADLDPAIWAEVMRAAYEHLGRQAEAGVDTEIDPYAAESPAEFFAVTTEYFFEAPEVLQDHYPAVYEQYVRLYRQDPLVRLEHLNDPANP